MNATTDMFIRFENGCYFGNSTGYNYLTINRSNTIITTTYDLSVADITSIGSITTSGAINAGTHIYMNNNRYIYSKNTSGTNEIFCIPRFTDNVTYFNCGSGGYNFRNNSSASILFMNSSGTVGIGITTIVSGPQLQVNGSIYCSGGSGGYYCRAGINGANPGNRFNTWWTGTVLQCWIDATNMGNFTICDYRVKENITQPKNVLDKLCSINMIDYEFKNISIFKKDNTKHLGLLAHELQDTFPEYKNLVFEEKDAVNSDGNIQPQSVSNDIVFILMKAIQELKNEIDMLKEIINKR